MFWDPHLVEADDLNQAEHSADDMAEDDEELEDDTCLTIFNDDDSPPVSCEYQYYYRLI